RARAPPAQRPLIRSCGSLLAESGANRRWARGTRTEAESSRSIGRLAPLEQHNGERAERDPFDVTKQRGSRPQHGPQVKVVLPPSLSRAPPGSRAANLHARVPVGSQVHQPGRRLPPDARGDDDPAPARPRDTRAAPSVAPPSDDRAS